jgi:hypothetical protein
VKDFVIARAGGYFYGRIDDETRRVWPWKSPFGLDDLAGHYSDLWSDYWLPTPLYSIIFCIISIWSLIGLSLNIHGTFIALGILISLAIAPIVNFLIGVLIVQRIRYEHRRFSPEALFAALSESPDSVCRQFGENQLGILHEVVERERQAFQAKERSRGAAEAFAKRKAWATENPQNCSHEWEFHAVFSDADSGSWYQCTWCGRQGSKETIEPQQALCAHQWRKAAGTIDTSEGYGKEKYVYRCKCGKEKRDY